jgi:hypothetical protein
MLPTIMSRGPIDLWTRTPRFIAPFSALAPSHHNLSSADFITNIAESNFRYTQGANLLILAILTQAHLVPISGKPEIGGRAPVIPENHIRAYL